MQLNLGSGFLLSNGNARPATSDDSDADADKREAREAREAKETSGEMPSDLLNNYMQQNEGLRFVFILCMFIKNSATKLIWTINSLTYAVCFSAENAQLHQQRERLIHDHELVCRENERLSKKLAALGQSALDNNRRPSIDHQNNGNRLSLDQAEERDMWKEAEKGNKPMDNEQLTKQRRNDVIGISKKCCLHVCGFFGCLPSHNLSSNLELLYSLFRYFKVASRSNSERNLSCSCTISHN